MQQSPLGSGCTLENILFRTPDPVESWMQGEELKSHLLQEPQGEGCSTGGHGEKDRWE